MPPQASGLAPDLPIGGFLLRISALAGRLGSSEERGKGLGVVWEARIIRQHLYDASAVSDKFVPVLFSDASPEQIPTPIKGWTRYVVDTGDGYEELYRRLTGQPRLLRPALGTIRPLPTRRRQWSEGTMEAASSSPAPASAPTPDHAAVRKGTPGRKLWPFLQQEKNRQVGWLGGGVVVLAGGVWVVITFFSPPHPPPPAPETNVEAPGGGGAGRDIRGSTITVHPSFSNRILRDSNGLRYTRQPRCIIQARWSTPLPPRHIPRRTLSNRASNALRALPGNHDAEIKSGQATSGKTHSECSSLNYHRRTGRHFLSWQPVTGQAVAR